MYVNGIAILRACLESAGKSEIPPPPQDEARNGRGKRAHIGDLFLALVATQNAKNQLLCDFARALSLSVYGYICTRCRGSVFPYNTAFFPLATENFSATAAFL